MSLDFTITFIGIVKTLAFMASIITLGGLGFLFALSFLKSPFGGSVHDPDWTTRVWIIAMSLLPIAGLLWATS